MLKSLEIVNKLLNEQKEDYYELYNSDSWCPNLLSSVKIRIKELEQIKQDLEVLEILNKYIKVEHYRPIGYKEWKRRITMSVYEEIPVNYFGVTEDLHQFTKEESLKIESWIKSNKVGDNHD